MRVAAVCLALWAWPALAVDDLPQKPAEALYLQLGKVGLDPAQVYQVRGAALNRSAVQITLEDGTIAFTHDVMGRITGAFFEGYGEVLIKAPRDVERRSMSLFTGMAILEERFSTAYFRFNDDVPMELKPDLRAPSDAEEFVKRWDATAKNLALFDAMRLLMNFSKMLPVGSGQRAEARTEPKPAADRFLRSEERRVGKECR